MVELLAGYSFALGGLAKFPNCAWACGFGFHDGALAAADVQAALSAGLDDRGALLALLALALLLDGLLLCRLLDCLLRGLLGLSACRAGIIEVVLGVVEFCLRAGDIGTSLL